MSDTPDHILKALSTGYTALGSLIDALPDLAPKLTDAIELIHTMEGRLIITGLGKSGHVGAKLAATFASTGTPAYFLHPTEASHGDLGLVQPTDIVLALSWSGETRELSDVIGYAKRRNVPVIALTGVADSTLGDAATLTLALPTAREACPHNLAPTTSTLLQMALGDAMAIALLQRKGLTEEGFRGFHPGGSLGAALKQVHEIMHDGATLPLIATDAPMMDAVRALSEKSFGIVGILQGPKLVGVITDGDVRRYLESQAEATMKGALHDTQVDKIMSKGSVTLTRNMVAGEALSILQTKRIQAAFVVDDQGAPLGLVTMLRLLNRGTA